MTKSEAYSGIRSCERQIEECNEAIFKKKKQIEDLENLRGSILSAGNRFNDEHQSRKQLLSKLAGVPRQPKMINTYISDMEEVYTGKQYKDALNGFDDIKKSTSRKIQELQREIEELRKKIASLNNQISSLQATIRSIEAEEERRRYEQQLNSK